LLILLFLANCILDMFQKLDIVLPRLFDRLFFLIQKLLLLLNYANLFLLSCSINQYFEIKWNLVKLSFDFLQQILTHYNLSFILFLIFKAEKEINDFDKEWLLCLLIKLVRLSECTLLLVPLNYFQLLTVLTT
jgi:hypothetical protein